MKIKQQFLIALSLMLFVVFNFSSCKEYRAIPIKDLSILEVKAADVLLNTDEVPVGITTGATFVVFFSENLELESLVEGSVTLKTGENVVDISLTGIGNKLTITTTNEMLTGRTHTLTITEAVKSYQGVRVTLTEYEFIVEGDIVVFPLEVNSVKVDGKELDPSTTIINVSTESPIVITFSSALASTTVNATSISLVDISGGSVASSLDLNGQIVTLTPDVPLSNVSSYSLKLANTLESSEGGEYIAETFHFQSGTTAVIPPQADKQSAFWRFNGNSNDATGSQTTLTEQYTYVTDRYGVEEAAASFNGDGDIMEVLGNGSLMASDWTMSVWVNIDVADLTGTRYFAGIGVENGFYVEMLSGFENVSFTTSNEDAPGSGVNPSVKWGAGSPTTPVQDKVWAHLAFTMSSNGIRRVYMNGVMISEEDLSAGGMLFNAAPAGINNNFALGYLCGTASTGTGWAIYDTDKNAGVTYKGLLDDVRVFTTVLTAQEVTDLYDLEK